MEQDGPKGQSSRLQLLGCVIWPSRLPTVRSVSPNLISWKPWRLPTVKLTSAKVVEFYRSGQPIETASEYDEQADGASAEDGDGQLAIEAAPAAPEETEAGKKEKHNYTSWQ